MSFVEFVIGLMVGFTIGFFIFHKPMGARYCKNHKNKPFEPNDVVCSICKEPLYQKVIKEVKVKQND